MDKDALERVEIDYENAIRRFAGNEALYEKYLYRFKDDEHLQECIALFMKEREKDS